MDKMMRRIDYRAWAGAVLSAWVLAHVGCSWSSTNDPAPAAVPGRPAAGTGPSSRSNVLANLGNPAAVLIISGEQDGYLEPCGCTEDQLGGLLRRYELVECIRGEKKWPVALVDLGSVIKNPAIARGGIEQAKFKFDYGVRALALSRYSALALSAEDLKIGVGEALGLLDNALEDTGKENAAAGTTKVVVANLQAADVYQRIVKPSVVVAAGPVKLGVTAVIDPEAFEKLKDPEKDSLLPNLTRPDDILPGVLRDLQAKSDFQILMVQGPPELAKRLAGSYPGFDVVVSTSEFDDPNHEPDVLNGGKTMLVTVGRKGKYVGAIGLYPSEPERLRFQLVTLNKGFDGSATPMRRLIEVEYREMLKAAGVVKNFLRSDYARGAPGATFVGAATCKGCHPNTYMFWSTTKHFRAFESLKNDHKPNTIYDAECVTCHTTGFEYNSGWRSEEETPHLAGNQCENCHGPGSRHAAEPDNPEFRNFLALKAEQADKDRLCIRCHDLDNSRNFEFAKYWPQIMHKGLDTYTDPKVHRGITPRLPNRN
jgi:hypothetical protein